MVPQDPRKQLGAAMRHARRELGLSQEELAARCSLHRTYMGSVERGERNVSLENIIRIATALGLSASALLANAKL